MLNNSHKMPNNTRSIGKMSQPTTIVCEYSTAPRNELDIIIIFDLNIIFMLILFREKNRRRKLANYNGTSTTECQNRSLQY